MSNSKYDFRVSVPAPTKAEANQKAKAITKLARQLDGKTLEALAAKAPGVLADSTTASIIRNYLGI